MTRTKPRSPTFGSVSGNRFAPIKTFEYERFSAIWKLYSVQDPVRTTQEYVCSLHSENASG